MRSVAKEIVEWEEQEAVMRGVVKEIVEGEDRKRRSIDLLHAVKKEEKASKPRLLVSSIYVTRRETTCLRHKSMKLVHELPT